MARFWEELVQSRIFWLSFFSAAISFKGWASLDEATSQSLPKPQIWPFCEVELVYAFPGQHYIKHAIDLSLLDGEHRLHLHHKELTEPLILANWGVHHMPDLWRWAEFLAITEHLAQTAMAPAWAHKLLLSLYVPITQDYREPFLNMLQECLQATTVFDEEEIGFIIAAPRFAVQKTFRWLQDPDLGWVAEREHTVFPDFNDAHSMRKRGSDFNFARFNKFMAGLMGQC